MKDFIVFLPILVLVFAWNFGAAVVESSAVDHASSFNLTAPWFGATPTKVPLELHRRGWDDCLQCGGAERLGAVVKAGNLTELNETGAAAILDAVRAHGIVVIKGQNLTRAQQVDFTGRLGEVIVLPSSFEGKDPEPFHPAIQRITNFWANGTWKGPSAKLGAYWHQDGQFWVNPNTMCYRYFMLKQLRLKEERLALLTYELPMPLSRNHS